MACVTIWRCGFIGFGLKIEWQREIFRPNQIESKLYTPRNLLDSLRSRLFCIGSKDASLNPYQIPSTMLLSYPIIDYQSAQSKSTAKKGK